MKKSTKRAAEVGAGVVTAAALAAAAVYWISEKTTKSQRTKAKAWIAKARKEIAHNVVSTRHFSEGEYKRIVDQALKKYQSLEGLNMADIVKAGREFKAEWTRIQAHAKNMSGQAKRTGSVKKSAVKRSPR